MRKEPTRMEDLKHNKIDEAKLSPAESKENRKTEVLFVLEKIKDFLEGFSTGVETKYLCGDFFPGSDIVASIIGLGKNEKLLIDFENIKDEFENTMDEEKAREEVLKIIENWFLDLEKTENDSNVLMEIEDIKTKL